LAAIGLGLVVGLVSFVVWSGFGLAAERLGVSDWWREILKNLGMMAVSVPLGAGFSWSLIRASGDPKPTFRDLFQSCRPPWCWSLLFLAIIVWLCTTAGTQAVVYLIGPLYVSTTKVPADTWALVSWIVVRLFVVIITILTLFVGPLLLAAAQPSLLEAMKQQWRLVRVQWPIIATICLLIVIGHALEMVTSLAWPLAAPGAEAGSLFFVNLALSFAGVVVFFYVCFVVAAAYRAFFGLPGSLQPARASAELPPALPL
jgi:hypothetical protein